MGFSLANLYEAVEMVKVTASETLGGAEIVFPMRLIKTAEYEAIEAAEIAKAGETSEETSVDWKRQFETVKKSIFTLLHSEPTGIEDFPAGDKTDLIVRAEKYFTNANAEIQSLLDNLLVQVWIEYKTQTENKVFFRPFSDSGEKESGADSVSEASASGV